MNRIGPWRVPIAVLLVITTPAITGAAAAAQVRTIDIGGKPADSTTHACAVDSLLDAALLRFNSATTTRAFGTFQVAAGTVYQGNVGVFQGVFKLDGTIQGDVVVLNADARITRTGSVTGTITIIGGRLTADAGSRVGNHYECESQPALSRLPNGTVARTSPNRTIGSYTSGVALRFGAWRVTPIVGVGQYNRVEALPLELGARATRGFGTLDTMRFAALGVIRSGTDPNGSRQPLGWHATLGFTHAGSVPLSVRVEGGSTVVPTVDQPYTALESGLSAFVLRRDYADWYLRRGGSVTITAHPWRELSLTGSFDVSHETTVLAVDALSLLRSTETWRPNPLIDDGTYRTWTGRAVWDARDPKLYPVLSWYARVELHHVSGSDITPVSLPQTIREPIPVSGYGETDGELDVRGALRISPEQRLSFRLYGGGYMGGDPLTIQRRRAAGSADLLPGFDFRGVNCDRQRRALPSTPALCDRNAAIQVEYHRTLGLDLRTRIGAYTVGIRKPDLVFFGDAASAWLAGDSAGRVPADRIQSLREWRSDLGVGITSGPVGLYLAKAVTDAIPVRLTLLLHARF